MWMQRIVLTIRVGPCSLGHVVQTSTIRVELDVRKINKTPVGYNRELASLANYIGAK